MTRGRLFFGALVGLLLSTLPISGALYRSNSLGQSLGEIEAADRDAYRYVLQVDKTDDATERKLLYDRGHLAMQVETVFDASDRQSKVVTEQYFDELGEPEAIVRTTFDNSLPIQITRNAYGTVSMTLHGYVDGRLVETKELVDGELVALVTYYRGSEGNLAGLRIIGTQEGTVQRLYSSSDGISVFGEASGNSFAKLSFHPGNLVVQDVWAGEEPKVVTTVSHDEAGQLAVEEVSDGLKVKKTYGPDGMLVKLERTESDGTRTTIRYQYDPSGVLDQSVEVIEGQQVRRIERWYAGGNLQTQTEWSDDIPVRATRHRTDGTSVVTLFENGRPYVDVTYAPDGKRVLSLEYRKER